MSNIMRMCTPARRYFQTEVKLAVEPNAWAGGKGSCAVCVDLQAVGALQFFGELCSLAKGFGPIFEGVWAGFREREGSIF